MKRHLRRWAFERSRRAKRKGYSLLAAGLIQRRIKNSAAYLEDLNKISPNLFKGIHQIRQETV